MKRSTGSDFSTRMRWVQSPIIPVVGELVRENPGTISLGQGVVNYGPPPEAIEHIQYFLADPQNHKYQQVQGIEELAEPLTRKLREENGIGMTDGRRLLVTAGGNMAFVNAVLAVTNPGDEVILLLPYYFNHEMAIGMAGCRAICVPTDSNYQPQPALIEKAITKKTRAVVTISPNNPTGAVYPESVLRRINRICAGNGIYHIHDEAYEYFLYDGAHRFSPGALDKTASTTISLYSLSKAYGFASWRIGYMVAPDHLFMDLKKVQDTILICPPVISQWAAVGALKAGSSYCGPKIDDLADVRHMVMRRLAGLEGLVKVPPASGAFYFFLKVDTDMNAMALVERLVREYKVAVIPGTTFGLTDGCFLRVAYGALEKHTVEDGMERLVGGLTDIVGGRKRRQEPLSARTNLRDAKRSKTTNSRKMS